MPDWESSLVTKRWTLFSKMLVRMIFTVITTAGAMVAITTTERIRLAFLARSAVRKLCAGNFIIRTPIAVARLMNTVLMKKR